LDDILEMVVKEQGFLRKEIQHRNTKSKIDQAHYKFFYTPTYKTIQDEEYVLLDILFENINYKKIVPINIQSSFVPNESAPFEVDVPSLEDILSDKLTAFAPNTTGIPYFKGNDSMSMEIIKQLYDIGNLVDKVTDLEIIKSTFKKFALTELAYKEKEKITIQEVLEDTFQTALSIVTRGVEGKGDFEQLQLGIQRVTRFIFSENYHLEKAITHATKTAYIATLIKHDAKVIEQYNNPLQMKDWTIGEPLNPKLNRLKKTNPEAFYYWYKIYELETKKD